MASPARAEVPFADEMNVAFAKLGFATDGWGPRLSPPCPDAWPMTGPLALRYHAYAARFGRGLSDGEYVAGIWAVGVLAGKSRFEVTSRKRVDLGIQGVRPVSNEELAVFQQEPSLRGWWDELATDSSDSKRLADKRARLRPYYCAWKKLNGVIAKEIVPKHAAFFAWLACD